MITGHFNHDYIGGAGTVPENVGDRFYSQDLGNDFHFLRDQIGLLAAGLGQNVPLIVSGGVATKGTGNTLNITACVGFVEFEVRTIDLGSAFALPPVSVLEDETVRVASDAQVDMAIGSAVLDDAQTNYVKLAYAETSGLTRNRAKKAGSYVWSLEPSFLITVDTTAPVAGKEIELARFISVGNNVPAQLDISSRTIDWPRLVENLSGPRKGYLVGLEMGNSGSDPNNDVGINAGEARDDSDTWTMVLAAPITKQLDAAWAEGNNQGGLDTGSKAINSTYHVFIIREDSTGDIDALYSLSPSSPTMPSGWTAKRRIGAILTDGSNNILTFQQIGDRFDWTVPKNDINQASTGTSAVLHVMTVPTGIKVQIRVTAKLVDLTAGSTCNVILTDPDMPDVSPGSVAFTVVESLGTVTSVRMNANYELFTNTSGQIRRHAAISAADITLIVATQGWVDRRGRDDA